ncbi:hypothetical protein S13b_00049 [Klebsiella phage VLCpiS13b]|uniref:hypothetical protein n=1 Tax=Klebsiella phage VLCpiS13b TaxID=2874886 RepID=UPI00233EEEFE|nr:hypothetical protein PRB92_gp76 [Klebsiella phage VLCpiS13b]UVX30624.1 hypothetical protein S13b_00049 [Klebsiella phage VLCpiS13b]
MTDYSKMSDFEINTAVSMAMLTESKSPSSKYVVVNDYCNNPADAWPIIIENGISIVRLDKNWLCAPIDEAIDGITGDSEVCFYASKGVVDNKPFRAAMIVFLMMQEKSNGG